MEEQAKYECDLHCHTTRSDGADTPEELIINARRAGVKVLAVTDHDKRPPVFIQTENGADWDIEKYAEIQGVKLLKGIEISCETEVEDVHIVCFGCEWTDSYFDELERKTVQSKIDGYQELVWRLNKNGIAISWDEVLNNSGNPVPEHQVQKKMLFELMANKGYVKDWSEAKLLIKNTPEYHIKRNKPDPIETIRQIKGCGGITILAHPLLISETVKINGREMERDLYIRRLFEAGLNGIEVCYTYSKTSYNGRLTDEEARKYVFYHYGKYAALISGGSDYHADHKKGVKNARRLGESGVTYEYARSNEILSKLISET